MGSLYTLWLNKKGTVTWITVCCCLLKCYQVCGITIQVNSSGLQFELTNCPHIAFLSWGLLWKGESKVMYLHSTSVIPSAWPVCGPNSSHIFKNSSWHSIVFSFSHLSHRRGFTPWPKEWLGVILQEKTWCWCTHLSYQNKWKWLSTKEAFGC